MSKPFTGFSSDKQKTIRVPEGFFSEVLPQIGSVLELKVTLYLFWRLARSGVVSGSPRIVSLGELQVEETLKAALAQGKGPRPFEEALREGLELAVARGTVLQLRIAQVAQPALSTPNGNGHNNGNGHGSGSSKQLQERERVEYWFLLNTRENKAWVEALGNGEVDVLTTPMASFYLETGDANSLSNFKSAIIIERPNVYTLYEQNIGLLTPIVAEKLQDAEGHYPVEWINAAFEEAVLNNKRNWRYIERILERWTVEGRQSGKDRGSVEQSL
ncbi:MAG: DnaD domain protein, partial [Chloroflexota bacterium]